MQIYKINNSRHGSNTLWMKMNTTTYMFSGCGIEASATLVTYPVPNNDTIVLESTCSNAHRLLTKLCLAVSTQDRKGMQNISVQDEVLVVCNLKVFQV